jgi:hypothetical protein
MLTLAVNQRSVSRVETVNQSSQVGDSILSTQVFLTDIKCLELIGTGVTSSVHKVRTIHIRLH